MIQILQLSLQLFHAVILHHLLDTSLIALSTRGFADLDHQVPQLFACRQNDITGLFGRFNALLDRILNQRQQKQARDSEFETIG